MPFIFDETIVSGGTYYIFIGSVREKKQERAEQWQLTRACITLVVTIFSLTWVNRSCFRTSGYWRPSRKLTVSVPFIYLQSVPQKSVNALLCKDACCTLPHKSIDIKWIELLTFPDWFYQYCLTTTSLLDHPAFSKQFHICLVADCIKMLRSNSEYVNGFLAPWKDFMRISSSLQIWAIP